MIKYAARRISDGKYAMARGTGWIFTPMLMGATHFDGALDLPVALLNLCVLVPIRRLNHNPQTGAPLSTQGIGYWELVP